MKKFILCVVAGYALVFTLFIGLPQMMGGRGGTLVPKGGRIATPDSPVEAKTNAEDKESHSGIVYQKHQTISHLQEPKDLKHYETGSVETFYQNGTLSSEWILSSPGTGVFKTYTPDGHPWMTMAFVNNVLEGELKIFYPEGPVFSKENYGAGERKGSFFWQYKNGNPWLEIIWSPDGTAHLAELYSEDKKRVDVPAVQTGQSTGYFKAFDEQGHEVINLQQVSGEQKLVLKSYYGSGSLSAEVGLKGKSLHGRMVRYYPDGTVWMETEFLDGRVSQDTFVYREDKVLSYGETPLTEPQGGLEWKAFYPDGKIFWQLTKLGNSKEPALYQLTTHWQDESTAEDKKERVLV